MQKLGLVNVEVRMNDKVEFMKKQKMILSHIMNY